MCDESHASEDMACCAPSRDGGSEARVAVARASEPQRHDETLIRLEGGRFLMGADDREGFPSDREGPVREVTVAPFLIDAHAVTNARFAEFVADAGYRTEAEQYGWSFVFAGLLPVDIVPTRGVAAAQWWRQVYGACWRAPEGAGSAVEARMDHPVVHVSWNDATAYCEWAGVRLPTEAEWEFAARGGLVRKRFAWGDELTPGGRHMCNIWQGTFPTANTLDDGYQGTAPVTAFPPNGYGLRNTAGNVWEWCADWWGVDHTRGLPGSGAQKVIRGGSYLCHASYCNRYRVAARSSNTPDSSTGHMGFRCVADG
jgi:formylglycine-generating enzyme required for sulfatase activity